MTYPKHTQISLHSGMLMFNACPLILGISDRLCPQTGFCELEN
jgi:hypothetical protein